MDLRTYYPEQRRALYQDVLDRRLENGDLDANDRSILAHIADTLALTAEDLRPAHQRAFGLVVVDALEDGRLCVEERLLLYKLQHTLGLNPRLADGAYTVLAQERLLRPVAHALSDGGLSPDEETDIVKAAADLDVEISSDIEAMLDAARNRWQARTATAPAPKVRVKLASGEKARFETNAWWRYANASRLTSWVGYAAVQAGKTQGLLVPTSALKGSKRVGSAVVTNRNMVLQVERGLPERISLDRIEQTLRFRNGAVIRLADSRRYFIDAGRQRDELYRHLYYAIEDARESRPATVTPGKADPPSLSQPRSNRLAFRFPDVRWRKVLTAEVLAAKDTWLGRARSATVTKRLGKASRGAWAVADIGLAEIDAEHLTFLARRNNERRRTSLRTIEAVHAFNRNVWISRQHSHDWLVRCPTDADAERLAEALMWNTGTR